MKYGIILILWIVIVLSGYAIAIKHDSDWANKCVKGRWGSG